MTPPNSNQQQGREQLAQLDRIEHAVRCWYRRQPSPRWNHAYAALFWTTLPVIGAVAAFPSLRLFPFPYWWLAAPLVATAVCYALSSRPRSWEQALDEALLAYVPCNQEAFEALRSQAARDRGFDHFALEQWVSAERAAVNARFGLRRVPAFVNRQVAPPAHSSKG